MKKTNIALLMITLILSLCAFGGLIVYALHMQEKKDAENNNSLHPTQISAAPTVTNEPKATVSAGLTITPTPTVQPNKPVVLAFAGDVNLDEDYYPVHKYDAAGKALSGIISNDLVKEMKTADVMMLNNEFCFSTRGAKTPDKSFTFRAAPGRVDILKKMGVDIVSLANNHALDYGQDALTDTFETLDKAGIDYVGAGKNMERAKSPIYYEAGGKKIAFLAASRVVMSVDWFASSTRPGMLGTYEPSLLLKSIKEAKANSDYVIVFVHWGLERHNYIETYQRTLAQNYIDAGADAVIGCHPHTMQGFEYYKGKPIAYSLGNFIFSNRTDRTGLLKLYLDGKDTLRMQILPAKYSDTYTYLLTGQDEKTDYIKYMKKISYHVNIDKDGYVTASNTL